MESPQEVVINPNESWQDGVVLVYSTMVLMSLRLCATIRHSPLSPIGRAGRWNRAHLYALGMVAVGAGSTLTLLLLTLFEATREVAKDLMPCASPLLAIGGTVGLLEQSRPPKWGAQTLTEVMGLPLWSMLVPAVLFNGMTIAASIVNGAWAATSISVATTLIAIFGPRTPVVANTVANGLVEAGHFLLAKVIDYGDDTIIALSFWEGGEAVREFSGDGWTKLQSDDEIGHDKNLRIGVYPTVKAVYGDDENLITLPLIDANAPAEEESCVSLYSSLSADCIGSVSLQEFLQNPVGQGVEQIELSMDDFTLSMLYAFVFSACHGGSERKFPGALITYSRLVRKLMEPIAAPDQEALSLPASFPIESKVFEQLQEFGRSLVAIDNLTELLPFPHKNIISIALAVKASRHYEVHSSRIHNSAIGALANALVHAAEGKTRPLELCILFEGMHEELLPDDEVVAVMTSDETHNVQWYTENQENEVKHRLASGKYAVIRCQQRATSPEAKNNDDIIAVGVQRIDHKLRRIEGVISEQTAFFREGNRVKITEEEWNQARLQNSTRVWPANWDPGEPASAVGKIKGLAEIATLQAVASGIAAGSVLLGRLLGG